MFDLQTIKLGTADETYALVKEEIRSTGAPTWEERAAQADPHLRSVYLLGLDNGPDNGPLPRKIRNCISGCPYVMYGVVWCLFHQGQLVVLNGLQVLENWSWTDSWPVKYFTACSIISTAWRSHGIPEKMRNLAEHLFSPAVARHIFGRIPGRCLRNRWLAIQDCPEIW